MTVARLLFNPNAGRAKSMGITMRRVLDALSGQGIAALPTEVDGVDGIPRVVESLGSDDLLVIAGGDGTVYEVVQYIEVLRARIAIIPLGTANNLATTVGIPAHIGRAAEVAAHGTERMVDLGKMDDRIFTQAAGAGFHAEAFRTYGKRRDRSLVRAGEAFISALVHWRPEAMRITVDGEEIVKNATQVTVANTPVYGTRLRIAPGAKVDDGRLDVVVLGEMARAEVIAVTVELMEGRTLDSSKVTRVLARRVMVEPAFEADIAVHADAEPMGYAPVSIEVLPACLRLMMPR